MTAPYHSDLHSLAIAEDAPLAFHSCVLRFTVDGCPIGFAVLGASFAACIDLPGTRFVDAFVEDSWVAGTVDQRTALALFREEIRAALGAEIAVCSSFMPNDPWITPDDLKLLRDQRQGHSSRHVASELLTPSLSGFLSIPLVHERPSQVVILGVVLVLVTVGIVLVVTGKKPSPPWPETS